MPGADDRKLQTRILALARKHPLIRWIEPDEQPDSTRYSVPARGVVLYRSNAGIVRARGGVYRGGAAGLGDLTGWRCADGRVGSIELKDPTTGDRARPAQERMRELIQACGGYYAIVTSEESFLDSVQAWLTSA